MDYCYTFVFMDFIFVLLWNILKQFVKLFIPKKEEMNEQA